MEDYSKPASKEWVSERIANFQHRSVYFYEDNKSVKVDITTLFELLLDHLKLEVHNEPSKTTLKPREGI